MTDDSGQNCSESVSSVKKGSISHKWIIENIYAFNDIENGCVISTKFSSGKSEWELELYSVTLKGLNNSRNLIVYLKQKSSVIDKKIKWKMNVRNKNGADLCDFWTFHNFKNGSASVNLGIALDDEVNRYYPDGTLIIFTEIIEGLTVTNCPELTEQKGKLILFTSFRGFKSFAAIS